MGTFEHILLIFTLVLGSSFFSMSEIALAASRRIRLQVYANEGNGNAKKVLELQDNPGNFFTLVQIGLNAVAILGGVVGESTFTPHIIDFLTQYFDGGWIEPFSFAISVFCITSLFILFADLIPKRLAMLIPETIAMFVVNPILFLITALRPLVWFFDSLSNLIFRMIGVSTMRQDEIIPEDIMAMVDAGEQAGVLQSHEHKLLGNVLELESRTVACAMTSRENVIYFTMKDTQEEIKTKIANHPHGKFLVIDEVLDNVLGFIDTRELFLLAMKNQEMDLKNEGMLKTPLMIPDSLSLYEILAQFKSANNDFGVVINEYALVMGVVTLKDVMTIVMGELVNYTDKQITQRDANSWLVDGSTPFSDVMRMLEIKEFPDSESYDTIAGFMMYMLRKVPKRSDFVVHEGYKFEVVDTDNYKIDQLLVTMI